MTAHSHSPSPTPILILDRVSKRFAGHTAVDELSLSVPSGVIYGLLGPNGAGKTTTLRMIMDILEPDGGAVRVFGEPGGGRAHAERIGYLPEERGLYRKMRVLDVLVFLGEMKGIVRGRARQRAEEWLARLGLTEWRLRRIDELSRPRSCASSCASSRGDGSWWTARSRTSSGRMVGTISSSGSMGAWAGRRKCSQTRPW